MTPERWQQIKNLVNSALDEDAETCSAVLRQSCADDVRLHRGAEALLSFHQEAAKRRANAPALAARMNSQVPLAPDRWKQVEQLFQSALELEPHERAAFLGQACGADEDLRHEVESLLVYQAAAGGLIQGAIHQAAGLLANAHGEKARFTPGMTLNKRYRIVGLLGQGGMGEVYRADDLKLGRPVALKFLTEKLSRDKAMLARFHSEVSMAHRVTHPNVCRVHDIGEVTTSAGTQHFLSMEYVDGEDLSSLLRRIGRLPADKAIEIANQLCAGLAAAHEAGVLHRDLKPANVMLDGKGRVRITDFGLAGIAEQIKGDEVFAGTPAYMSPEQFAGKEVTTKSDIYALGLVLYEIFTGKRVFEAGSLDELRRMHESSAPATPSSWVKNLDPLVERVILRCLEKDPAKRLASAKQVADALPGGDPLAAALALGETPTPEMVAAAGAKTGLRPKVAVACLAAIIIGLIAAVHLQSKVRLIDVTPFENSPEILSRKAREIIAQLGYSARPTDTAHGFDYDRQYLEYIQRQVPAGQRWQRLGQERPATIFFWYRESPQQMLPVAWPLSPRENGGQPPDISRVKEDDPPMTPGMIGVRLDTQGRLIRLNAAPSQLDEGPKSAQTDWTGLFAAAGIDAARLSPAAPKWTPPSAFDARAAWIGSFPEWPDLTLRVEAAAWRGRPVYFEVIGPWITPDQGSAMAAPIRYMMWIMIISSLATFFLGGWLVWRNLRQGRSDRKGAFRLASFVFICSTLAGIIGSFVPTLGPQELGLRIALTGSLLVWVLYVALEPYVRRRWPVTLISWSRVLAGSVRDPLVGRDVLFGILIGVVIVLSNALWQSLNPSEGIFSSTLDVLLRGMSSGRLTVGMFLLSFGGVVIVPLVNLFTLFLLRLLLRRDWLAAILFTLIYAAPPLYTGDWPSSLSATVVYGLSSFMLIRYGLMTLGSSFFVMIVLTTFPVTLNFSVWYAGTGMLPLLFVLALAVFAFYTSLGGQQVFEGKLLEE